MVTTKMLLDIIKDLLLPKAATIMSQFTKAIDALDAKRDSSQALARKYHHKYYQARVEAVQCDRYAGKLKKLLVDD